MNRCVGLLGPQNGSDLPSALGLVDYNIGDDGVDNGESLDDDDENKSDKSSSLYQCRA